MNLKEKYYPLGTVVLLKNANKKIVITGYAGISLEKTDEMYDYIACLYPEGVLGSDKNLLFNHDQIDQVIFEGYSDEEDKIFKEKLKKLISNTENEDSALDNNVDIPILAQQANTTTEDNSSIETL